MKNLCRVLKHSVALTFLLLRQLLWLACHVGGRVWGVSPITTEVAAMGSKYVALLCLDTSCNYCIGVKYVDSASCSVTVY